MCGITGVLHFEKDRIVEKDRLKKMTDIIRHRGPDGEGFYIDNNIGLGHRRLAIIDLETGDQPMLSDDKQLILVFNGEIYNYIEIKEELKLKGYQFHTESDTEVILKSYEEWGHDCQNKFNGMWAFALWDVRKQELFLSRDRMGEKPLHYSVFENSFVFGSEMKSLFSYGIPKIPDLTFLEIYFITTYFPDPHSFYKNISKLEAGTYLTVKEGKVKKYKYWDLPEIDESNMIIEKDYVYDQFEYLFKDSVKIRMRSDVPFGAFLSGGLDSSSIVSVMSEMTNIPINTFTIGFPEKDYDETILAQQVAENFGTIHYNGQINPYDFDKILENVAFHFDEPFGDTSSIPTGVVSKFASEKVKMVLTGDGGDEVLSGYNSYAGLKMASLYQRSPGLIQKKLPQFINEFKQYSKGSLRLKLNRIENILETSSLPFEQRMIQKRAYTDFSLIKNLTSNISDIYPIEDFYLDIFKKCSYKDEFYKLMYLDIKYDLPNAYLVKVDRMSMAHSLETRAPFLDYRLIEFMIGVDKKVKMKGWERKTILRKTIGKSLPKSLLNAPKRGFDIPLTSWFKDEYFSDKISNNLRKVKSLLDNDAISEIVDNNSLNLSHNGSFIWMMMKVNKMLN